MIVPQPLATATRWANALPAALVLSAIVGAAAVWGAEPAGSGVLKSGGEQSVYLEYEELDYSFANWNIGVVVQSQPFKKEPSLVRAKVVRGQLQFAGGAAQPMAFAWDRSGRTLYLDLNRNLDLTDDAAGVFSASERMAVFSQTFTNVHLTLKTAFGARQFLADLSIWDYGSHPYFTAALRSLWQGKITLDGEEWQVGVAENPFYGAGTTEGNHLLLRPWVARQRPFSTISDSLDAVPFPQTLFFQGHAWQLACTNESPENSSRLTLRLTPQQPRLGELRISGDFIQRLTLEDNRRLVVIDQTNGVVRVPVGSYVGPKVWLKKGDAEAFSQFRLGWVEKRVSIDEKRPANLAAGGPLTNVVAASRRGGRLYLTYELVGVGGEKYNLVRKALAQPPEFAVYHAGERIGAGQFEFG